MNELIHLELHTADLPRAGALYSSLLGWRAQRIEAGPSSYTVLGIGERCSGGIVECGAPSAMWLPYVAVRQIDEVTARAAGLGADVVLGPREGPAGWRSVVRTPVGGEIAFWQSKRRRGRWSA
jgi:predicted enzyme related to lactoylglutathione lyase